MSAHVVVRTGSSGSIEPQRNNPQTRHWGRAFDLIDLLL
jgi:hypothetical protein